MECPVCLDPILTQFDPSMDADGSMVYKGPPIAIQTCGHLFHNECLQRWLRTRRERDCPVCRKRVGRNENIIRLDLRGQLGRQMTATTQTGTGGMMQPNAEPPGQRRILTARRRYPNCHQKDLDKKNKEEFQKLKSLLVGRKEYLNNLLEENENNRIRANIQNY